MKVLIDTNVLIDFFGRREPYFKRWSSLCAMQEFGDAELWVAPQSFADAFYILSKHIHADDLQEAFCSSLKFLNVCNVGTTEVAEALRRQWTDYEDCLVALCAENIDADFLLSRDASGFQNAKTPTCSLDDFFQMLESEYGLVYEQIDIS